MSDITENAKSKENKLNAQNLFFPDSLVNIEGKPNVSSYYSMGNVDWQAPPMPTDEKSKAAIADKSLVPAPPREGGKPSIFNRYSIFFFNNTMSIGKSSTAENYMDDVNRIDKYLAMVRLNPTAKNILDWSSNGNTNAVDYAIEDFLWCKNYGQVPNNYLITLRRFPIPVNDDIFDKDKTQYPDTGRMLSWVDGVNNKWADVGLSWTHSMKWKPLEAEIQQVDASNSGYGTTETGKLENIVGLLRTDYSNGFLQNPNMTGSNVGYDNKNVTYGPLDVIDKTTVRDRGLNFEQKIKIVFEYKLKSIDGINQKIAFMDLLSNILLVTSNRGPFWGGDVVYYGANPRRFKPIGDPATLQNGDFAGYFKSVFTNLSGLVKSAGGASPKNPIEALTNVIGTMGGNFMSQWGGKQLDKMGRPAAQAINSLLTGESTGDWHLTVGNPSNPILSVGNLVLKNTTIEFGGNLGIDDFPTELKVTCELENAMPRDRIGIISMFHRNNRTYLTTSPISTKYTGNLPNSKGSKNGGNITKGQTNINSQMNTWRENFKKGLVNPAAMNEYMTQRFPNHVGVESTATTHMAAKEIG
jgi:hypothetical protein